MRRLLLGGASVLLLAALPVMAADKGGMIAPTAYSAGDIVSSGAFGCQLGVEAGGTIAETDISVPGGTLSGAGSKSSRPDVGVRGECGYLAASHLYAGLFAEYINQDVQFAVNPGVFTASLGNTYGVGGRIGYMMGSAMPYALVEWVRSDANWSVTSNLLPNHFDGWAFGGGVEFKMPSLPHLTLALETKWTKYDTQNITGTPVGLQPDALSAMVRLNYNFAASSSIIPAPLK